MEAVVSRLEAVASRLERASARMGAGGGGAADDDDVPAYVTDFKAFMDTEVKAMYTACKTGPKLIAPVLDKAFNNTFAVLKATAACKKPDQGAYSAFLKPTVEAEQAAEKLKYKKKTKFELQYRAFYECINANFWVTMAPPAQLPLPHVVAQGEASDFHLNKLLVAAKGMEGAAQEKARNFVKSMQAMNKAHAAFVKQYFKAGLSWNPKGQDLSSFDGSALAASASSSPSPAAEESKSPAPEAAKPKVKAAAAGGMASVFGQLNKGTGITSGLKKVKKSQKTKYRKDRSGLVSAPAKKKTSAPAKPKKPPVMENQRGRWIVENYFEGVNNLPETVDMKENVFISRCQNCVIVVPAKVKAVAVDGCKKCRVFVDTVVSSVEMVNCSSTTVIVRGTSPSISVDKSDSARIILSKAAVDLNPNIFTSCVSAMNIEVPGATEEADSIEIAVPEQFLTKIDPQTKKPTTADVKHG